MIVGVSRPAILALGGRRERRDAELHQERERLGRQVGTHRRRDVDARRANRAEHRLDVRLLPVEQLEPAGLAVTGVQRGAGRELGAQPAEVGEPLRRETVGEVAVRAVVGEVGGEDAARVGRKRPEESAGDSDGPRSVTVSAMSPSSTVSPSATTSVGNARCGAHSAPNIGRRICSLTGSSRRITSLTLAVAKTGSARPSSSATSPP